METIVQLNASTWNDCLLKGMVLLEVSLSRRVL